MGSRNHLKSQRGKQSHHTLPQNNGWRQLNHCVCKQLCKYTVVSTSDAITLPCVQTIDAFTIEWYTQPFEIAMGQISKSHTTTEHWLGTITPIRLPLGMKHGQNCDIMHVCVLVAIEFHWVQTINAITIQWVQTTICGCNLANNQIEHNHKPTIGNH